MIEKTKEIIGGEKITEYLEPSAGGGVFLDYLDKPYLAYDIEPEDDRVVKQDYLELVLEYKEGRCVIGNPPFGVGNTLSVKFYKKSIELADYIAFIQPISQLDNNMQMYEFDLVYSKDLGLHNYSEKQLHCCFNIYRRPNNNVFNKRPNYKLKDITLRQSRRRNGISPSDIDINDYDIAVCIRGDGSAGKICTNLDQYNDILLVKCHNIKHREAVISAIECLRNHFTTSISSLNITSWQVYKYLKEQIPELE